MENAALVATDPRIGFASVMAPRADPRLISDYADHWWAHDPTAEATASSPVGQVTDLDFTGRERFFSSPFYNDYWRRSGLGAERLATNLFTDNGGFASIILQASERRDEIDPETQERFRYFIPHFVRSIGIARNMQRMTFEKFLLESGYGSHETGTVIVDPEGRVIFADDAAEDLFSGPSGITVSKGRLHCHSEISNGELNAAIVACSAARFTAPASRKIKVRSGEYSSLSVEVRPFRIAGAVPGMPRPAAMLLVSDPERRRKQRIALLQDRFGFTPAEARLALEMLAGDGRAAAASRCGVSINTARTQLTSIFEKVGVTRQAELIRALLEAEAIR
ncbi:helix-turn-helix transcriptional regulator [Nitratireductor basaltis]|uniref:helix-turn-helix transcriptional regulator n=1 Tax=Nitratireductor basaltis TaxID=472175 RepID=UPI0012683CF2|nr:helix-turn-helix transcriptional regulator [Nitratireductor basaltis]